MILLRELQSGRFTGYGACACSLWGELVDEWYLLRIVRPSQKGTMGPNGCNTTATYDQDAIDVRVGAPATLRIITASSFPVSFFFVRRV